jgi:hypothetical protein
MLTITIPESEYFDDGKQEFLTVEGAVVELEHSLVSLSKWEQKWEIPFLGKDAKTSEQTIDYIRCMILTPEVSPAIFKQLTSNQNLEKIRDYIDAKMTATWFTETRPSRPAQEQITSELIYYWMIALTIPETFETWHLNRLLTLIKVCNLKNQPPKKMSAGEIAARNRALNEQRLSAMKTTG